MADFTVKKGDVGKSITGQFLNANGTAINCTGNTARKFFMRRKGKSGIVKFSETPKINGAAFTFSNEATGLFSYTFTALDLDTAGDYAGEFEVTLPGGVVVTIPTNANEKQTYISIEVQKDLG
jgi:hypothetical protein